MDDDEVMSQAARLLPTLTPTERVCPDCGKKWSGVGPSKLCDACIEAEQRAAEETHESRRIAEALNCVPESHGWVLERPELVRGRVTSPAILGKLDALAAAPVVTFLGDAGTGKTSLATALFERGVRRILAQLRDRSDWESRHDRVFAFVTSLDVVAARRRAKLGESEPELIREARRARILVLDDLGLEQTAFVDVLVELIHDRYARQRQTIVTTGVSAETIAQRYGGGIARRLLEAPSIAVRMQPRKP